MTGEFRGLKAVVVGAGADIGEVVVRKLVCKECAVVEAFVQGSQVARPMQGQGILVDLMDDGSVADFSRQVREIGPDIMINVSGISISCKVAELSEDDFRNVYKHNVISPLLICQAGLDAMKRRRWGRIVNLGRMGGGTVTPNLGAYVASKAALELMTAALANEYLGEGVLANCVAYGDVPYLGDRLEAGCVEPDVADKVSDLIVMLASPGNTQVTGQLWAADRGFSRFC